MICCNTHVRNAFCRWTPCLMSCNPVALLIGSLSSRVHGLCSAAAAACVCLYAAHCARRHRHQQTVHHTSTSNTADRAAGISARQITPVSGDSHEAYCDGATGTSNRHCHHAPWTGRHGSWVRNQVARSAASIASLQRTTKTSTLQVGKHRQDVCGDSTRRKVCFPDGCRGWSFTLAAL